MREKFKATITTKNGEVTEVSPPKTWESISKNPLDSRIPILEWKRERPTKRPPIAFLDGVKLITPKNICAIVAKPSFGKSSVCTAILAKIENPNCDGLGWEFSEEVNKALWFDCERTAEDIEDSMSQLMFRADIHHIPKCVNIVPLKAFPKGNERMQMIKKYITEFKPNLIIIDGAGDLVQDANNIVQCSLVTDFFRLITEIYNLVVITTLHPNEKGQSNGSARGHIGSELRRESQCVLDIIMSSDETRSLTSRDTNGKVKFGDSESHFKWNDEIHMFSSCEKSPDARKKGDPWVILSNEQIDTLLLEAMGSDPIGYTDLIDKLRFYLLRDHKEKINSGQNKLKDFKTWLESGNFIKAVNSDRYTKYTYINKNQLTLMDS